MNWKNVRLIVVREVRDQLRDRRMVLLFVVLPVLMYPFLGMTILQMGQFAREHPTRVLLVGPEDLPKTPPMVDGKHFAKDLFRHPDGWEPSKDEEERKNPELAVKRRTERLVVTTVPREPEISPRERLKDTDAVVVIPPGFAAKVDAFRKQLAAEQAKGEVKSPPLADVPSPDIYYDSGREASRTTYERVETMIQMWGEAVVREGLSGETLPLMPFRRSENDLANAGRPGMAMWARIFPFLLVIWCLTGAFQPAVDLVAGEKERGTLETLLASPTPRIDIVAGKMMAVMLTSISTVVLNLLSMGLTGSLILSRLPGFGSPPLLGVVWLMIALIPLAAFFSALCLGLAAFARSAKEGNYYMIPLFLVVLPPTMIGISPTSELTLGKSLIPLAGLVTLLRVLIEGNYALALPYVFPVVAVTVLCAVISMRWAIDLFSRETVLFREAERFDVVLWIRSLARDAGPVPSFAMAMFCGMLILLLRTLTALALSPPKDFHEFATKNTLALAGVVLVPPVLLSLFFAKSRIETFSLRLPAWWTLPAAALAAVLLHPLVPELARLVKELYPDVAVATDLNKMLEKGEIWVLLLAVALAPALIEELAFRGFILSGLRTEGSLLRAVIVSSLFFGVSHLILQQAIVATLVGVIPALMVLSTRSIWPGVVFHFCHNALLVGGVRWLQSTARESPGSVDWLVRVGGADSEIEGYRGAVLAVCGLASLGLAWWWQRQARGGTPLMVPA